MAVEMRQRAKILSQEHLFRFRDSLSEEDRIALSAEIENLDIDRLKASFTSAMINQDLDPGRIQPPIGIDILMLKNLTTVDEEKWRSVGMDLIAQGKVAVVILAGGQGTRLGTSKPKGCFDVGLPSHKSLFQIHIERIKKIQSLAGLGPGISVYIMTSVHTHKETEDFFKENHFFGLIPTQVKLFQQGQIPCFAENGEIILETKSKIAISPNGNGGIYEALETSGSLDDMSIKGIQCVDCFSVDNLLAKAADPLFMGYCYSADAQCGARVVSKAYPEEKVGVFASVDDRCQVVEYSELSEDMAKRKDGDHLHFNWGNICMHYFSLDFLKRAAGFDLRFHVARKSIQSVDGDRPGIKLEKFIFDVFPLADKVVLMEVRREENYAPVKNAAGSPSDSPDTARYLLMTLHRKWLERAGAKCGEVIEVSPLISYEGEGLESTEGRDFRSIKYLDSV